MKLISKTFSLCFAASLLLTAAAAQTPTPAPREKLVLQIFRHEGAEPVYQEVPGMDWSPVFRRVKTERPLTVGAPVRAVQVVSTLEEPGVRVQVLLLTGERFHDKAVRVASFVARAGEEVTVRELERYGVEPFRVVVLRREPASEVPPAVVNKTRSIEATSAIDRAHKWPAKLVARNLSGRGVLAIGVKTTSGGRVVTSSEPQGEEGLPLIAPGATYESHVPPGQGQVTAGGYVAGQTESIVLAAAVFDDGSYEGEPGIAASVLARRAAMRLQLERTIPLLRGALGGADADAPAALARLKAEVAALDITAGPGFVEAILQRFDEPVPRGEQSVRIVAEVMMHYMRKTLLDELTSLERTDTRAKAQPAAQQAFSDWLRLKLDAYEKWLARL